ncbi:MAG TPA: PTS sugar transporter subunit IIA [candidate division WOR-3 bacterium]|uniref:PTS sugar transporter subunit IIA n=2 Tax=candidate division WOR-3 bacterium TaxID=2052148 RepID=A0A7C5E001_UNCW3|nr:PTS sugar transporter subunit IIA [Candidatus Hydrothermae bacterium]RKY96168.1 MAG: PTS sugar transporter subunit IIA [Candidatus Hydrothermae bacterium]HHF57929.1 PTS sugar transporter subunit IIA [candidate division WOR-3 bacterium]
MLEQLLKEERVILDLKSKDKESVLEELLEPLNLPEERKKLVLEALKKRESIGSTGIGKGIAIPHTRSVVLDDVYLVVGRSKEGVDFQALDGKPVHLFFLLCAPPQDPGTRYLITLGMIANIARKIIKSDEYMKIQDKREFIDYLLRMEKEE